MKAFLRCVFLEKYVLYYQSNKDWISILIMESQVRICSSFAPIQRMVVAIKVSFNSGSQMLIMFAQDSTMEFKRLAFSMTFVIWS